MNGIAGSSDLFCLLAWLLRDDFRCVVFDYPSATGRAEHQLTAQDLAADLFAVADSEHDEAFSLFATSFGSVVALTALGLVPKRFDRVILQGGFAYRRLSPVECLLCRAGRFLPGTLSNVPFREVIQRANHQRSFPPFDFTRWNFFVDNAGQTAIRDVAERAAIVGSFDFRSRLAEIRQPVLLIQTEHEGLVSASCHEELERDLLHATTEHLHSTGHLCYLTHPHRLAKCVRSFLGEAPQERLALGNSPALTE